MHESFLAQILHFFQLFVYGILRVCEYVRNIVTSS